MATVYVNDTPVDIGDARLNLIQAAERAGVFIPHYCWHPALTVVASCRMCLVEMGSKQPDGSVQMMPKVVPGCQTLAKDGTVIVTNSGKAKDAQASTLEGLLINHPLDCPVCDKAGECKLQDFSFKYGHAESRMIDDKRTPPNKPHISDKITLFTDRCIMCSRCVRFTREISGTSELQVINRGEHAEIDIFPGQPLNNKLSGNVVDLCPVGALGSKDFLYKQRVWYLKTQHQSVCPGCSTGCSIEVDTNKDIVFRLRPRENPEAQGHFMCDEGRYGYHYINDSERISRPHAREAEGSLRRTTWKNLFASLRQDIANNVAAHAAKSFIGVLSPMLTCEEAYLFASYLKSVSPNVVLALGKVPVIGEDDKYPKNWKGEAVEPVKFVIRAEKAPNRLGVETVLKHFQGSVIPFAEVVGKVQRGEVKGLYLTAGYPDRNWLSEAEATTLGAVDLLIVQDFFLTPLAEKAQYLLPATSFAEKDGIFINHAGLAQAIKRATRSPGETRVEGQVFLDLLQRPGLISIPKIRQEMAKTIPALQNVGNEPYPKNGTRLNLV